MYGQIDGRKEKIEIPYIFYCGPEFVRSRPQCLESKASDFLSFAMIRNQGARVKV